MQFEKEEILPILISAMRADEAKCNEFAINLKDFLYCYTKKDCDLNLYHQIRCLRLWYVITWISDNLLPDEIEGEHNILLENYKRKISLAIDLYKIENSVDLLNIFENKMLKEWEQKRKDAQTVVLETK